MCDHSEERIYKDKKMLYALQEIGNKKFIIAASEYTLFDTYLEHAKNDDKKLNINYSETDNEPYKIVYGSIIVNLTGKLPLCATNVGQRACRETRTPEKMWEESHAL